MAIQLFTHPAYAAKEQAKKLMTTRAKKAKGRRLQDLVRDTLKGLAPELGVEPEDIKSCLMGDNGLDIKMSKAAEKVFALDVECKNVEKLSVVSTFFKHFEKYTGRPTLKVLIHKLSHKEPLITMRFIDFMPIYRTAKLSGVVPGQAVGEHDVPQV